MEFDLGLFPSDQFFIIHAVQLFEPVILLRFVGENDRPRCGKESNDLIDIILTIKTDQDLLVVCAESELGDNITVPAVHGLDLSPHLWLCDRRELLDQESPDPLARNSVYNDIISHVDSLCVHQLGHGLVYERTDLSVIQLDLDLPESLFER